MRALSAGTLMAWQLAASEARRTRQRYIEREAMFIGICRLGAWLRTRSAERPLRLPENTTLEALRAEAAAVEGPLWALGVSPTRLYHAVRTAVGAGVYSHSPQTTLHRSQACKAAFQRAAAYATTAQADTVHCLHMLAALLESPGSLLTGGIAACQVTAHTLQARVLATPWLQDARTALVARTAHGVSHLIYVGTELPGPALNAGGPRRETG